MKNITYNFLNIYSTFFSILLLLSSCSKDRPVAPQAGTFEVTHDIPENIPASGGSYNLTIDASTNGWWLIKPDNTPWISINRIYGSAKVSQQITVSANTDEKVREVTIVINSTNNVSKNVVIKQDKQE